MIFNETPRITLDDTEADNHPEPYHIPWDEIVEVKDYPDITWYTPSTDLNAVRAYIMGQHMFQQKVDKKRIIELTQGTLTHLRLITLKNGLMYALAIDSKTSQIVHNIEEFGELITSNDNWNGVAYIHYPDILLNTVLPHNYSTNDKDTFSWESLEQNSGIFRFLYYINIKKRDFTGTFSQDSGYTSHSVIFSTPLTLEGTRDSVHTTYSIFYVEDPNWQQTTANDTAIMYESPKGTSVSFVFDNFGNLTEILTDKKPVPPYSKMGKAIIRQHLGIDTSDDGVLLLDTEKVFNRLIQNTKSENHINVLDIFTDAITV